MMIKHSFSTRYSLIFILALVFPLGLFSQSQVLNIPNGLSGIGSTVSGNDIGIGTASPNTKLHIYNNVMDAPALILQGSTISSDAVYHYVGLRFDGDYGNATGNYSEIRSHSNMYAGWGSSLTFHTTATGQANTLVERMRILPNGNVGIGISQPDARLHISYPSIVTNFEGTQNTGIRVENKNATDHFSILGFGGWSDDYPRNLAQIGARMTDYGSYLYFGTSNNYAVGITNTAMVIDYNGKVGLGTTTPLTKLHINNGPNSDAAILATSSEENKLIVSSGFTQPAKCETFRITQQFSEDRNNGFIGFNRGNGTNGGFLTFGTNGIERLRIDTEGKVGIGTESPGYNSKLQVVGGGVGIGSSPFTVDASLHITSSFGGADRLLQMSPIGASKPALNLIASTNSTNSAQWWVWGVTPDNIWRIQDGTFFNGEEGFSINPSGNVGIGTTSLDTYRLNVAGNIRANEIIVNTSGADFVFDPGYNLLDLAEVEKYIEENKHLPDVAPASEMQTDGMNVSEMQTKLLQKIEELTLYIIEQKKVNQLQSKEIEILKQMILQNVNQKLNLDNNNCITKW
ncbi:MAG TPA: hypothetical protein VHO50_13650 [Bacteroidales bacterium]|nr:hypothetical protein [Bacteroidales bacterium]